jgi:hypothetical protein
MIIYTIGAFILLLIFLIVITDKYNPAIQFHIITGFGLLFLYDEEEVEEGTRVIFQVMFGIILISITYIKDA